MTKKIIAGTAGAFLLVGMVSIASAAAINEKHHGHYSSRMSPEKEKEFLGAKKVERAVLEVKWKKQAEEAKTHQDRMQKMREAMRKGDRGAYAKLMHEEQQAHNREEK